MKKFLIAFLLVFGVAYVSSAQRILIADTIRAKKVATQTLSVTQILNGATGATQAVNDNSTKLATTAYTQLQSAKQIGDSATANPFVMDASNTGEPLFRTIPNGVQTVGLVGRQGITVTKGPGDSTLVITSTVTPPSETDYQLTVDNDADADPQNLNNISITEDTVNGGKILHIPDASTTVRGVVTTGTQTFAGTKVFASGFSSASNQVNSNLWVMGGQGAYFNPITSAEYQLRNSSAMRAKVGFKGSSNSVLGVGETYANVVVGATPITEAASGTHDLIAGLAVRGVVLTNGAATTQTATNLYVGAPENSSIATENYSAYINGKSKINGTLEIVDPADTDNSTTAASTGWVKRNMPGYTLQGSLTTFSPAQNTAYYIGSTNGTSTSTAGHNRLYIPVNSSLKKISIFYSLVTGSTGTATENTAFTVQHTAASTGGTVSDPTTIADTNWGTTTVGRIVNNTLNIPMAAGDWFEIKMVTPTSAGTLPTGVRFSYIAYFE